jgi:hypothetical protein
MTYGNYDYIRRRRAGHDGTTIATHRSACRKSRSDGVYAVRRATVFYKDSTIDTAATSTTPRPPVRSRADHVPISHTSDRIEIRTSAAALIARLSNRKQAAAAPIYLVPRLHTADRQSHTSPAHTRSSQHVARRPARADTIDLGQQHHQRASRPRTPCWSPQQIRFSRNIYVTPGRHLRGARDRPTVRASSTRERQLRREVRMGAIAHLDHSHIRDYRGP